MPTVEKFLNLNLLEPSGPVQACIGIHLLYLYHLSLHFYLSSLLIPPCPYFFLVLFCHTIFPLLSPVFSYFCSNTPPHSCCTFQHYAACVSRSSLLYQLRTNNFRQYFMLFTNSYNFLPSSLTRHPILVKSIYRHLAHFSPHATRHKDLARSVVA
jgi:hypothetical protein